LSYFHYWLTILSLVLPSHLLFIIGLSGEPLHNQLLPPQKKLLSPTSSDAGPLETIVSQLFF